MLFIFRFALCQLKAFGKLRMVVTYDAPLTLSLSLSMPSFKCVVPVLTLTEVLPCHTYERVYVCISDADFAICKNHSDVANLAIGKKSTNAHSARLPTHIFVSVSLSLSRFMSCYLIVFC